MYASVSVMQSNALSRCHIDMGVQLFLDIVRSLKPSHIIRFLSKESCVTDTIRHLPPLTEELFTSTPGLFTPADGAAGTISQSAMPQQQFTQETWQTSIPEDVLVGVEEGLDEDVDRTLSSDLEMYGSSEEEFCISDARLGRSQ